jgi:hypothetical protein
MTRPTDRVIFVTANSINKSLKQTIVDGDLVNTASNLGTGTDGEALFTTKSSGVIQLKRIKAGTNVSLTSEANDIVINATASGGTTLVEVWNTQVTVGGSFTAPVTGVLFFKAPQAFTINNVVMQIFTKNGIASGSLTIDIKKNSTPNPTGMTSIFSVLPTTNYATNADYATNSGTISSGAVSAGDYLRLDLTAVPSTTLFDKFFIMVYGS